MKNLQESKDDIQRIQEDIQSIKQIIQVVKEDMKKNTEESERKVDRRIRQSGKYILSIIFIMVMFLAYFIRSDSIEDLNRNTQKLNLKTQEFDIKTQELHQKTQELDLKTQELDQKTQKLQQKTRELNLKTKELHLKTQELHQKTKELYLKTQELDLKMYSYFGNFERTFEMEEFSKEKDKDKPRDWKSPPMYTHIWGYKFCIVLDANGRGESRGKALYAELYVMPGEYDNHLKWRQSQLHTGAHSSERRG